VIKLYELAGADKKEDSVLIAGGYA